MREQTIWRGATLCSLLTLALIAVVWAAPVQADDFDRARCERSEDLVHWRCTITCTDGDTGISSCPSATEWGACGAWAVSQVCEAPATRPAAGCLRKHVLVGEDAETLKAACGDLGGFASMVEADVSAFPGSVARKKK